jgi:hypothetical protein
VHAAGESSPGNIPNNTNAVVLSVPDEPSLRQLERQLSAGGVPHVAVHEPDAPWDGAMTAIGFVPVSDRSALKRFLSKFPLLGQAKAQAA